MTECEYCKDLNEEKYDVEIHEVYIQGGYYNWGCMIRYCPYCGRKLDKYKEDDE